MEENIKILSNEENIKTLSSEENIPKDRKFYNNKYKQDHPTYQKEYKQKNKDHIKEYQKKYYENNDPLEKIDCECGLSVCKSVISRHKKTKRHLLFLVNKNNLQPELKQQEEQEKKQYYETHRQQLREYSKKYRDTNKEILKEKRKEKIKCDCGLEITKLNIKTHQKSNIHKKLIENRLK